MSGSDTFAMILVYVAIFGAIISIAISIGMKDKVAEDKQNRAAKACMPYVVAGDFHFGDNDYAVCKDTDGFRIKETERPATTQ